MCYFLALQSISYVVIYVHYLRLLHCLQWTDTKHIVVNVCVLVCVTLFGLSAVKKPGISQSRSGSLSVTLSLLHTVEILPSNTTIIIAIGPWTQNFRQTNYIVVYCTIYRRKSIVLVQRFCVRWQYRPRNDVETGFVYVCMRGYQPVAIRFCVCATRNSRNVRHLCPYRGVFWCTLERKELFALVESFA